MEVQELIKRSRVDSEIVEYVKPTQQRVFKKICNGGLRGLQILSLAECRNLSDVGLAKLS